MKKSTLAAIKATKAKRLRERRRLGLARGSRDPKDLRGAKGVLRKAAIEAVLEDELSDTQGAEPRHPPIRIRTDW